MTIRRLKGITSVAAACTAIALLSLAMPALAAEESGFPAADPDPLDLLAAETLAAEYKIDKNEAIDRIMEQDLFEDLVGDIAASHPEYYAGSSIDHDDAGQLRVFVSDAAIVNAVVRSIPIELSERVEVVTADLSLKDLDLARLSLETNLNQLGLDFEYVAVNQETNRLEAHVYISDGKVDGALEAWYERASEGLPVSYTFGQGQLTGVACLSTLQICDSPLRGGIEITDATWNANNPGSKPLICTAGFTVKNRESGAKGLMTAGHCDRNRVGDQSGYWITGKSNFTNKGIGRDTFARFTGLSGNKDDVMIINVDDPSYWNPGSTTKVLIRSNLVSSTWYSVTQPYLSPSPPPNNAWLCSNGAAVDGSCHQVTGSSGNFIRMNVPAAGRERCQGDSGGPVVKNNKGYGMISSILAVGPGTLDFFYQPNYTLQCAYSGGTWFFYELDKALSVSNHRLL